METEGTNKLVRDTQIEHLQFILQQGQNLEFSIEETRGIAYDLITFFEVLAEDTDESQ